MDRFDELEEKFNQALQSQKDLEEEYKDGIKGELYQRKSLNIIQRLESIKRIAASLGSDGNIILIIGKLRRPHKRNPSIVVEESFKLYFTNLTIPEAEKVMKMKHKNVKNYTITNIKPGDIIYQ